MYHLHQCPYKYWYRCVLQHPKNWKKKQSIVSKIHTAKHLFCCFLLLLIHPSIILHPSLHQVEWPCISFTDNYMDLFHREALIRMLEILIASIISLSPPLIPPPPYPSILSSIHPSILLSAPKCLRIRQKQTIQTRREGGRKSWWGTEYCSACRWTWILLLTLTVIVLWMQTYCLFSLSNMFN